MCTTRHMPLRSSKNVPARRLSFAPTSRCQPAVSSTIRIAYMARHFDDWYHRAGADEIIRYVEDLALWGINGFHMSHAGAMDDFFI